LEERENPSCSQPEELEQIPFPAEWKATEHKLLCFLDFYLLWRTKKKIESENIFCSFSLETEKSRTKLLFPGIVVHAYNPSTWEAEAGEFQV
jgi:hypothetical protein